jgi:hypothetical protein
MFQRRLLLCALITVQANLMGGARAAENIVNVPTRGFKFETKTRPIGGVDSNWEGITGGELTIEVIEATTSADGDLTLAPNRPVSLVAIAKTVFGVYRVKVEGRLNPDVSHSLTDFLRDCRAHRCHFQTQIRFVTEAGSFQGATDRSTEINSVAKAVHSASQEPEITIRRSSESQEVFSARVPISAYYLAVESVLKRLLLFQESDIQGPGIINVTMDDLQVPVILGSFPVGYSFPRMSVTSTTGNVTEEVEIRPIRGELK